MGPREKIGRSMMTTVESIKDAIGASLVGAVTSGDIKLEQPALAQLISLVNSTIEAGYRKGEHVFDRDVQAALAMARQEAMAGGARPPAKKKTVGASSST